MSETLLIGRTPALPKLDVTCAASKAVALDSSKAGGAEPAGSGNTEAGSLLLVRDQNGNYLPASDDEVIVAAEAVIDRRMIRGAQLNSPQKTQQLLALKLGGLENEVFAALWLDSQHRLIDYAELSQGTIDGANVYPRIVVKQALRFNACACIFVHNHPSGVPEPSTADRALTSRLAQALALIDVRVLDHIVVAGRKAESFAERGWL